MSVISGWVIIVSLKKNVEKKKREQERDLFFLTDEGLESQFQTIGLCNALNYYNYIILLSFIVLPKKV